jgi:hypothetical protein
MARGTRMVHSALSVMVRLQSEISNQISTFQANHLSHVITVSGQL